MVGKRGFEPPTSCSQSRRATRLRYFPLLFMYNLKKQKNQATFEFSSKIQIDVSFENDSDNGMGYSALGIALLAGAVAGAVTALLFAPQTGDRTREQLRRQANRAWDRVVASRERINERVEELLDTIAIYSEELVQKGKELSDKERQRLNDGIALARGELDRLRRRLSRLD